MIKFAALLSVVGVVMLSTPGAALALGNGEPSRFFPIEPRHGAAPEPVTVIGLALGAGGVGLARWRSKRKAR